MFNKQITSGFFLKHLDANKDPFIYYLIKSSLESDDKLLTTDYKKFLNRLNELNIDEYLKIWLMTCFVKSFLDYNKNYVFRRYFEICKLFLHIDKKQNNLDKLIYLKNLIYPLNKNIENLTKDSSIKECYEILFSLEKTENILLDHFFIKKELYNE